MTKMKLGLFCVCCVISVYLIDIGGFIEQDMQWQLFKILQMLLFRVYGQRLYHWQLSASKLDYTALPK